VKALPGVELGAIQLLPSGLCDGVQHQVKVIVGPPLRIKLGKSY
jgi:hypothetical protein